MYASVKIALCAYVSLRLFFSKFFHYDASWTKSPLHFFLPAPPPTLTLDPGRHFTHPLLISGSTTYVVVDGPHHSVPLDDGSLNSTQDLAVYSPLIPSRPPFSDTVVTCGWILLSIILGFIAPVLITRPLPIRKASVAKAKAAPTPKDSVDNAKPAVSASSSEEALTPELSNGNSHRSILCDLDIGCAPCSTPNDAAEYPVFIDDIFLDTELSNTLFATEINDNLEKVESPAVPDFLAYEDIVMPSPIVDTGFVTCEEPEDYTPSTGSHGLYLGDTRMYGHGADLNARDEQGLLPSDESTKTINVSGAATPKSRSFKIERQNDSSSLIRTKASQDLLASLPPIGDTPETIPWGDSLLHLPPGSHELDKTPYVDYTQSECGSDATDDYLCFETGRKSQEPNLDDDSSSPIASSIPVQPPPLPRKNNRVMLSIPPEKRCVLQPLYIYAPEAVQEMKHTFTQRAREAGIVVSSNSMPGSFIGEEESQKAKQFWDDPLAVLPSFTQTRSPVLPSSPTSTVVSLGSSLGSILDIEVVPIPALDPPLECKAAGSSTSGPGKRRRTTSETIDMQDDHEEIPGRQEMFSPKRTKVVSELENWRQKPAGWRLNRAFSGSRCPWRVRNGESPKV